MLFIKTFCFLKGGKNMIAINIILGIAAAILLIGVIGEKDRQKQGNITIAFTAVIVLIIAINTLLR